MQGDIGALARGQDNHCNRGSAPIRLLPPNLTHSRPHQARRVDFTKVHNNGQRQASDAILVSAKLKAEYGTADNVIESRDVARIMSISVRAVYRLSESRKLPCIKWDRSVRFDPVDVAKFIEDNRREAIDIEALADTMCV